MEFGLKGMSRLVADVKGSRHSGLGFTVFWLFTAVLYIETWLAIHVCAVWARYVVGTVIH